jgi:rSAM/selenodomain-associated transferase 1
MSADRLLIFCRPPLAGRVKTRLSPTIAPDDAATLYEASLRDVIALAGRERARVELWYDGQDAERYFTEQYPHIITQRQSSGELGARQRDAFERSFADGAERVVLIGSDSPTLPEGHLNAAFDDLREAPGVVGPARDGGYYLIGFQQTVWPGAATIFDDIKWSTEEVLTRLLQRAQQAGIDLRLLPGWYDFDSPEDLQLLRADAAPESHVGRWFHQRMA